MKACILTIGDEILIGQTLNGNAAWLGAHLGAIGIAVSCVVTVGDDADAIESELDRAFRAFDLVITTGGLGPTHDDITKAVISRYFSARLVFQPQLLARLQEAFARRGQTMPPQVEGQAWLPDKANILPNRVGSAQGMLFERDGHYCLVLPGVPREMIHIMEESGLPHLQRLHTGTTLLHYTWRTAGVGESKLAGIIGNVAEIERFGRLAFLPKYHGVDLRISIAAKSPAAAQRRLQAVEKLVLDKAGKFIYASGDLTLEQVIGEALARRNETVSVAESCTGGLISRMITRNPGSSVYFTGGVVAYSNAQKVALLGVEPSTLDAMGAVSEETAREMAAGAQKRLKTTYALSVTGIAGPGGGTVEKPVGLVFVGLAAPSGTKVKRFQFGEDREINQERSAAAALLLLFNELRNEP